MIVFKKNPTSLFTILEPQNPWIDEFYIVQNRRATSFDAPILLKGSSGILDVYTKCILFRGGIIF